MVTDEDIISHCLKMVSEITGVRKDRVMSKRRHRDWVEARYLLFYMAVKKYNLKLFNTGKLTGFHHSTVIYGVKVISDLIDVSDKHRIWVGIAMKEDFKIDLSLRESISNIITSAIPNSVKVNRLIKAIKEHEKVNIYWDDSVPMEDSEDNKGSEEGSEEVEPSKPLSSDKREECPRIERKQVFN